MALIHGSSTTLNLQDVSVDYKDGPGLDAFARLRVSNPRTLFDSKLVGDNRPLFWDDQEVSGSGTTSTYSLSGSEVTLAVSGSMSGVRVRQSKVRFNQQPGKSHLLVLTGVLGSGVSGVRQQIGYFDDNDGVFFESSPSGVNIVRRSSVTGAPVDTVTNQSSWNIDKMDGTGSSSINVDLSKVQIFFIDFEWLGVGRIRFGFFIGGMPYYCHQIAHANVAGSACMSTPNLPIRHRISNDGTGQAHSMKQICSAVVSEGGQDDSGILTCVSTDGTHINANSANTVYAVLGVKLQQARLGTTIKLALMSMISETGDDFEWILRLNPTVAGTFTYSNVSNSSLQAAKGVTSNTVTGGTNIAGGFASEKVSLDSKQLESALALGSTIDGTVDEIVLCVRPLSNGSDIQAVLTLRELL